MNKRKLVDYTSMYEALATLMKTELPEVELYLRLDGLSAPARRRARR
mgnify:CR=1 FL=1